MNQQLPLRYQLFAGLLLAAVALYTGFALSESPSVNAAMRQAGILAAPAQQEIGVQSLTFEAIFNYEGVLRNDDGSLLGDGTYSLEVNLYDVATGGTALWNDTFTPVVRNGRFNVVLGSGASLGSVLDTSPKFIGIRVEGADEISPREELLRVPWAMYAKDANYANFTMDTLTAVSADNVFSADNVVNAQNVLATVTKYSIATADQFDVQTNLTSWQNNTNGAMCWVTGVHSTENLINTNCYVTPSDQTLHTTGYSTCQAHCFNYGQ